MTKKPLINAIAALLYIVIVSSVMFYGMHFSGAQDSVLIPISILSLFTFSAAVMAYIFGYEPFQLYFSGKKKEALDLFLKTLLFFGIITILSLTILFSGIIPRY